MYTSTRIVYKRAHEYSLKRVLSQHLEPFQGFVAEISLSSKPNPPTPNPQVRSWLQVRLQGYFRAEDSYLLTPLHRLFHQVLSTNELADMQNEQFLALKSILTHKITLLFVAAVTTIATMP